jgi:hypothetical protein
MIIHLQSPITMKNYIPFTLICILLLFYYPVFAQTFILYGDRAYGGSDNETFESMIPLPIIDNYQLLLAGRSSTYQDGDKTDVLCDTIPFETADVWLVKTDTSFNIIWQDDVGGNYRELQPRLSKTLAGNNYMFACRSSSDSTCDKTENCRNLAHSDDYWIYMSDSTGNKIWDRTLGGTGGEAVAQIIPLSSGDFIVAGVSPSSISGDKTVANHGGDDFWVVKLDSTGNKLWDKVYGGTGGESGSNSFYALPSTGGNFILAGGSTSPANGDVSDTSRGGNDVWIIKLDSAGTKLWDKRYGGSGVDYCKHIAATADNGFILCGATTSPQNGDVTDMPRGVDDYWVIKIDSIGNKQWDKRYGSVHGDIATWIVPAPEGGYWVGGQTGSDSASFEVSEPTYGATDYWVLKIDSVGNKICDKRFGAAGGDFLYSMLILPDSSVVLGGTGAQGTSAVKTDGGRGVVDYWLVRFKYIDGIVGVDENSTNNFSIYPNPTDNTFSIKNISPKEKTLVQIFNPLGEVVYTEKFFGKSEYPIHINLSSGIYFVQVSDERKTVTRKLVVQ